MTQKACACHSSLPESGPLVDIDLARQEADRGQLTLEDAESYAASILAGRDPDDVIDLIAERAKQLAGARNASIATLEPDGKTFSLRAVGTRIDQADACTLVTDPLLKGALKTASAIRVADGAPRLVVPMFGANFRGRLLDLARPPGSTPFSEGETRVVELFTNAAAGAFIRSSDRAAADRRLAAVMEITQAILQGVGRQEILQLVVRRARSLVGAAVCSLWTPEPGGLTLHCRAADGAIASELMSETIPLKDSLTGQAFTSGEPVNMPALADAPGTYQPTARLTNHGPTLLVPLALGGRRIGVMTVANMGGGKAFTEEDLAVVQAFGAQATVCLGYAGLREGLQQLVGPGAIERHSPEESFAALARTVVDVAHGEAAAIFQLDADGHLRTIGSIGLAAGLPELLDRAGRYGIPRAALEAVRSRSVSVRHKADFLASVPEHVPDHFLVQLEEALRAISWDTVVAVPVIFQGRAVGAVAGYYAKGDQIAETEVAFLKIIAGQAAISLELTRLFGLAQQKAALEERQRLARELHDSVSQALYGIALGAQTALDLLSKEPAALAEPLRYVQRLAEAGLAEMRALIFELRPESLEKEGLVAALRRQASLLRARYEVDVVEDFDDEPDLSLHAKESLYRIAQETIQNIARHSRATRVAVHLKSDGPILRLEITDNGIGFESMRDFPGHLGLQSMRERAASVGSKLSVMSAPGEGTRVVVSLTTSAERKVGDAKTLPPAPVYRETFVHQISGFYAEMASLGHAVQTKVLQLERMVPLAAIAERLQLRQGEPVVHVLRLRLVDGRPNHIAETFLRSDLFPGLETADLSRGSLYRLLRDRYGAQLARSEVVVEAGAASLEQAMQLELEIGAPLLAVKNIVHNAGGLPILFAQSWHRASESQVEFEVLARDG